MRRVVCGRVEGGFGEAGHLPNEEGMADEPGSAVPDDAASDRRIGRVLQDRYRITGRIAAGGMGIVYRAERLGLGRIVAIKFLHASMARDPSIQRRFEIEAQAMSRLCHPNCIGVLDFGVDDLPYVVIDYVEGKPLDEVLEKGPLPARRAVRIARQILAALAHAHAQGIVHRDIKPENVVLEGTAGLEDHVRILDFGLAKLMGSDFGLTVGVAVGTPNYMAPEQMSEGPIDGRADLYAAGIVLFELLTGRKPFEAEELGEIFLKHLGAPPPKLREVAPERRFSAGLEALILRAMAKRPADRFASAEAMAAALDEVPESYATPGPETVLGHAPTRAAAAVSPVIPHAPAGPEHLTDATVPWSSSRLLPLAGQVIPARKDTPAAGRELAWRRWFFERPFRLAVASGLGSAMLAGAMVAVGFSGRPVRGHGPAASNPPAAQASAAASENAAPPPGRPGSPAPARAGFTTPGAVPGSRSGAFTRPGTGQSRGFHIIWQDRHRNDHAAPGRQSAARHP